MTYLYLFAAIIAVLAGFIGLVILIKGFVDKSSKNINLGTIIVSIGLIIAVAGGFSIGKRAINSKRYHEKQRMMRQNCMQNCMKGCNMELMKFCGNGDSTAVDSNGMQIVTKVIMDKQCEKKCKQACKHHMN